MTDSLVTVEIKVPVTVTVKICAEFASRAELEDHIVNAAPDVLRGVEQALEQSVESYGKSAGWIDDNREAFVDEIAVADLVGTLTMLPQDEKPMHSHEVAMRVMGLDNIPYNAGPFPPDTHVWVLNKAICCGEGCPGATCTTPDCPCASGVLS